MKAASRSDLEGDAWRLYDYITRHFIATLSKDCTYLTITTTFSIGDEIFTAVGKTLIDPGYTTVMTWQVIPLNFFIESRLLNYNLLYDTGVW